MCCIYSVNKPFTLYYIIFTERYPHGIFAAGGALPTQEKKKRLKKLGKLRTISKLDRIKNLVPSTLPKIKIFLDTSKKLLKNRN